jgi:hypothetical protein
MSKWESLCTVMVDIEDVDVGERFDLIENYTSLANVINFIFLQRFAEELECSLTRYKKWYHLTILDDSGYAVKCFLFSTLKDLHAYLLKKQRQQLKKKTTRDEKAAKNTGDEAKRDCKKKRKRRRRGAPCPHIK